MLRNIMGTTPVMRTFLDSRRDAGLGRRTRLAYGWKSKGEIVWLSRPPCLGQELEPKIGVATGPGDVQRDGLACL